jgi:glutamine amidotransferase
MIAIIKYNAGNIRSVQNALNRLGYESVITDDPKEIQAASKVIFPGVGEASSAMKYLRQRELDEVIKGLRQPVLGICLGLQLMCEHSEEGDTYCLGIFENSVKKFVGDGLIPHMGWNEHTSVEGRLFDGVLPTSDVYFVHSYYASVNENTQGVCNYIQPFSSVLNKGNFYAAQFHPEKSASIGEKILRNFLEL